MRNGIVPVWMTLRAAHDQSSLRKLERVCWAGRQHFQDVPHAAAAAAAEFAGLTVVIAEVDQEDFLGVLNAKEAMASHPAHPQEPIRTHE